MLDLNPDMRRLRAERIDIGKDIRASVRTGFRNRAGGIAHPFKQGGDEVLEFVARESVEIGVDFVAGFFFGIFEQNGSVEWWRLVDGVCRPGIRLCLLVAPTPFPVAGAHQPLELIIRKGH